MESLATLRHPVARGEPRVRLLLADADARLRSLLDRTPSYWQKRSIECSTCGYGIARPVPPRRCPMCQRQDTWIFSPRRPYTAHSGLL
jgi:rubrerythrin